MDIWRKTVPGKGNKTFKSSEVVGCLIPLRNKKKAIWVRVIVSVVEDEVQEAMGEAEQRGPYICQISNNKQ